MFSKNYNPNLHTLQWWMSPRKDNQGQWWLGYQKVFLNTLEQEEKDQYIARMTDRNISVDNK